MLLLLSTFLTLSVLQAQKPEVITNNKPGWHKIGDAKVDFKTDKDKFILLGMDKYKEVQVKAKDAGVHIESMTVTYHGDLKQDIALKSMLKAGGESRKVTLKYPNLDIKDITFVYHTVPGSEGKKAEIELWGMK